MTCPEYVQGLCRASIFVGEQRDDSFTTLLGLIEQGEADKAYFEVLCRLKPLSQAYAAIELARRPDYAKFDDDAAVLADEVPA